MMIKYLSDTSLLMTSDNRKQRFLAEYYQARIRRNKLHDTLVAYDNHKLDFKDKSTPDLLLEQLSILDSYIDILERRAQTEGIQLGLECYEVELNKFKLMTQNESQLEE